MAKNKITLACGTYDRTAAIIHGLIKPSGLDLDVIETHCYELGISEKDDVTLTVDTQDETKAIVRPFPFDSDPLLIPYSAHIVPNRSYVDRDEFLHHFYKAERTHLTLSLFSDKKFSLDAAGRIRKGRASAGSGRS